MTEEKNTPKGSENASEEKKNLESTSPPDNKPETVAGAEKINSSVEEKTDVTEDEIAEKQSIEDSFDDLPDQEQPKEPMKDETKEEQISGTRASGVDSHETMEEDITPVKSETEDKTTVSNNDEKQNEITKRNIISDSTNEDIVKEKEGNDSKGFDEDENEEGETDGRNTTDYSSLTKEELINTLENLLASKPAVKIRHDVETLKVLFYKLCRTENEQKREALLEEGGDPEDFQPTPEPLEEKLKELLAKFRKHKADHNRSLELEKEANLKIKYEIIEELKDLVNKEESLNETFRQFRELQMKWRQAGVVPQSSLKDLWENYHHHVEKFYDYVKINKELRDLDLKKNMETKIVLCEKAEELLLESNVIKAFNNLQKLHNQWRETGPVPIENKEEIWERFKEATAKINKKHHAFFDEQKEVQKKNLELKTTLCEKAEEISTREINSHSGWDKNSNALVEVQNEWKKLGFAPKKHNNKIYKRFRKACDTFFQRKREFYASYRQEQQDNLQLKTDLCVQAEALKESTEWKKTTDELIQIQKRWKEIGPVPRKQSDAIWKRFRTACDAFFENKAKHFQQVDGSYEANLKKKEELIEAIKAYAFTNKVEENFQALKDFQRQWTEIGFVPRKQKDEIATQYREAINRRFDELKVDDGKKNLLKFKNRVETYNATKKNRRISGERDKLANKLKQLETDIGLLENNIGFFANTKNAESMIKEVQDKIDNARKEMKLIEKKINVIDDLEEEQ